MSKSLTESIKMVVSGVVGGVIGAWISTAYESKYLPLNVISWISCGCIALILLSWVLFAYLDRK